jgi:hypothetical protein
MGILDASLQLPASTPATQAQQGAETMLADVVRTYFDLNLVIDWHPADADGWITGDVLAAAKRLNDRKQGWRVWQANGRGVGQGR